MSPWNLLSVPDTFWALSLQQHKNWPTTRFPLKISLQQNSLHRSTHFTILKMRNYRQFRTALCHGNSIGRKSLISIDVRPLPLFFSYVSRFRNERDCNRIRSGLCLIRKCFISKMSWNRAFQVLNRKKKSKKVHSIRMHVGKRELKTASARAIWNFFEMVCTCGYFY